MNFKNKNIGFFDSGIGGISVLKNAIETLQNEVFVYFGDSKNAPYGSKNKDEIIRLCINICNFLIYENNCKAIVVACNTASSAAIKVLRSIYEPDIPIIGVEPAIKPAVENLRNNNPDGKILLLATPFTTKGEKLKFLLNKYNGFNIESIALDELAYMIETNLNKESIYDYLYKILNTYKNKVDSVILGCTHYYFIKDLLINILGEKVKIYDGIIGTNNELKRRLISKNINNDVYNKDLKKLYIYNSLDNKNVLRCYELLNYQGGFQ